MANEPTPGGTPEPVVPAPVTPAPQPVAQPQPVQPVTPPEPAPAIAPTAPDRTKEQFDKLLESNQRLYQANELLRQEMVKRGQANQTFEPIQKPAPAQPAQPVAPVVQPDPKDFIETDEYGNRFVNETKLQNAFSELRQQASQANSTVERYIQASEQRETDRQNKEAFVSYPELNPQSDKFSFGFHQQVRGILYDSMINSHEYGGKPLSFKDAADFVRTQSPATIPVSVPAVPAVTPEQEKAQQALKEQGSLSATGQPPVQTRQSYSDDAALKALQMRTRMGSDEALAERLKYTEHILTPDAKVT